MAGVAAILFALWLARDVLRRDPGTPQMRDIGDRILEGAMAFLRRQYGTITYLSLVVALLMGVLLFLLGQTDINGDGVVNVADKLGLGWRTAVAFLVGAFCSGLAGFIGMYVSVKSNVRCAAAAARGGLREAIITALRGGAVSGFLIVALSLLGVLAIYYAYGGSRLLIFDPVHQANVPIAPFLIVGFGFGASFVALFAQLGGGIYTKGADMGADLVGKVEAGIPEDDPRNAGVIADLVGDNVGDCAGRGADLFESTAAENIGAMILGVAAFAAAIKANLPHPEVWVLFPLVIRAFGLIATAAGVLSVRGREGENPMKALNRGYFVSVVLSGVFLAIATWVMMREVAANPVWLFLAGVVGIATSVAFVYITQYYTETRFRPVKSIVEASRTGPATNIVAGISVGFETTLSTALVIGAAILAAYWLGKQLQLPNNGGPIPNGGLFGTAVATMGMLMTAAYVLAMDTFGPITDNANGIVEMAGAGRNVRDVTDQMDAAGNTTKALTKGYAMGSAGLAAFLLFSAYLDEVAKVRGSVLEAVNLAKPEVFVGGLIGVMLVFLFSSLAIRAVQGAASSVIEEVRRQFRSNPKIMTGEARPDYARAVDITARAGLRGMVVPGLLAVGIPILTGVILRAEAVAALLMVGTIGGILLATFMNNGGGAWDNAKKLIESGVLKGPSGETVGKGTPMHAAAVVGDTVGDPFKDTAGPSLHVLVKLLSTITLVMAPIFI
jgi:K(+)-stimulated pyrophosphate-energized sodium pump